MNFQSLKDAIVDCSQQLAANGRAADENDTFSHENYAQLKSLGFFTALVPQEFGGAGIHYGEMCELLALIAQYHPSTALSCSMHQHIIAANRYNALHGRPGQALLEKVVNNQWVLVSTGAGDWLASNGELEKTTDGYLLSATKHFASASPAGDILVTSAPYLDPEAGWQVLHFPVSLKGEGVTLLENWSAMGMRGTGSNSVELKRVFIADTAIAARRPRGDFHMMWNVILPVALPLIMSVYHGIAISLAARTKALCQKTASKNSGVIYSLGELENALTTATIALESMKTIVNDFTFEAGETTTNEIVKRKTIFASACKQLANLSLITCGGSGYLRQTGIENLVRDISAVHFHPMQEKQQLLFTGSLAAGLPPPQEAF